MGYPPVPKTAVVTGCSTGIGLATAMMLRDRGWSVYATARRQQDLEMLAERRLQPVEIDLADAASVDRAMDHVKTDAGAGIGAVVNNAGFGQPGALEDLTRDALRAQYEVNVFGLHQVTRALLPVFRQQGAGRIVNISSVLGRIATPLLGAYCSSKFAVEALSDAQRIELSGTGIAVSIVEPGPIITAFRTRAMGEVESNVSADDSRFRALFMRELERRRHAVKKANWINKPPEAVGTRIIHALESPHPRRRYCVTPPAYLGAWLRRLAPYALTDSLMSRRVRRMQSVSVTPTETTGAG